MNVFVKTKLRKGEQLPRFGSIEELRLKMLDDIKAGKVKYWYNKFSLVDERTIPGETIIEMGTVVDWAEDGTLTIKIPFDKYEDLASIVLGGVRFSYHYTKNGDELDVDDINYIYNNFNDIIDMMKLPEGLSRNVFVRYHRENCPELKDIEWLANGDYVDLRAAEEVHMKAGEHRYISLGVSMILPKGYCAKVVPRSGTFKNFGLIQANSPGIIDESYCGDEDVWKFSAIALRDTIVHVNDRICQFAIEKKVPFSIIEADKFDGENRGGLGSTGVK